MRSNFPSERADFLCTGRSERKIILAGTISREGMRSGKRESEISHYQHSSQIFATQPLFMLRAECPYIPPRSEIEGEADVLHASSEDVLARLLS